MTPVENKEEPEVLAALVGRLEKTVEAGFEDMRREFRSVNTRLVTLEEWKSGVIAVDAERRAVAEAAASQAVRDRAYTRDTRVLQSSDLLRIALVCLAVLAAVLGVIAGVLSVVG